MTKPNESAWLKMIDKVDDAPTPQGEIGELVERLPKIASVLEEDRYGYEANVISQAASALEQQRQTIMELNYQVKNSDAADKARIEQLSAERDMLETEVGEQARLNGMGGERELALLARIAELEGKLDTVAEMGCANCAPTRAEWKKAQARIAELEEERTVS
jgi:hypothetical protein